MKRYFFTKAVGYQIKMFWTCFQILLLYFIKGVTICVFFKWHHVLLFHYIIFLGRRVIGISGSLIWSKTMMELIFNYCGEFQWSPEGPVSQIHSPHLHIGASGIFSGLLRSVQMLKREWVRIATGSYRIYSIPGKTAALVPEFAVEDLPLAELQPWFLPLAVKDLPLHRTFWSGSNKRTGGGVTSAKHEWRRPPCCFHSCVRDALLERRQLFS